MCMCAVEQHANRICKIIGKWRSILKPKGLGGCKMGVYGFMEFILRADH